MNSKFLKHILFSIISFVLIIMFIFSSGTIVFASENVHTNVIDELSLIERNIPTINDDFLGNKIIVTLTQEYSEVNKQVNIDDFEISNLITLETMNNLGLSYDDVSGKIIIKNIKDLTYVDDPTIISNPDEYRQILSFELLNDSKEDVLNIINELETLDYVIAAEPIYNFSVDFEDDWLPLNDTNYDKQWGLHGTNGIQVEDAWNLVGNGNTFPKIRVGIFEGGIQSNHPDLDVVTGNVSSSTNTSLIDHGNHVAGIIGAIGNNGIGISGIAQVEVALLNYGSMTTIENVEFVQTLTWAINNDIRIVNASFKFMYNDFLAPAVVNHVSAIQNYGNAGGLFICSAGNSNVNNDVDTHNRMQYPAGYADSRKYPQIKNVISVGSIDEDGSKSAFSNYGLNSVQIYAPGNNIYSTISRSSYGILSGTSMAAPHVTGVAALLLSIDSSLTVQQIRTAILQSAVPTTITAGGVTQNVIRLNAYNAVKYVLEHYSNTPYTLSNYSGTINTNKVITSDASYFDELNGFYKLDVEYAKSYEFISSSTNEIEVILYDENFNEISYNDLDSTSNRVHFIQSLNIGTYYLRTKYVNEDLSGTINKKIVSRNTSYLSNGENDILINTYNGDNVYKYINGSGEGFYKFTLVATKADGSTVIYPSEAILIKDHLDQA